MNYKETCEYLYTRTPLFSKAGASAYKPGLQTTHALDEHLGHPHRRFRTVHVGGTNGKGTTTHTLAAILQCAGYKVGLFTSPHLVDFRERIRVNGEMCSEAFVVNFVEQHRDFFEPLHPSFFEVTTAMAFQYFAEQQVDVAVIEVGLGGRLDCTNIITPELSVVTNISLDHTDLLGQTLAEIATEKAGIMKPNVPFLLGEARDETLAVFQRRAEEIRAPFHLAHAEKCTDWQEANLCTIRAAAELLRHTFDISEAHIHEGITRMRELTGLRGRWETLSEKPLTICDVGHNPGAWEYLNPRLEKLTPRSGKLYTLLGMCADKDVRTVVSMLPKNATYLWTQANTHRAIPATELAEMGSQCGLQGTPYPTVKEAYEAAKALAGPDDVIFIGGSCYIIADLLSI